MAFIKERAKKGTDFTVHVEKVLELVSNGESVQKSCQIVGIARTTFLSHVDSDSYARARTAFADVRFDRMTDLVKDCLEGKIEPHAFRAAMDAEKWILARTHPKYNEKLMLELSGGVKIGVKECEAKAAEAKTALEAIRAARGENQDLTEDELYVSEVKKP